MAAVYDLGRLVEEVMESWKDGWKYTQGVSSFFPFISSIGIPPGEGLAHLYYRRHKMFDG